MVILAYGCVRACEFLNQLKNYQLLSQESMGFGCTYLSLFQSDILTFTGIDLGKCLLSLLGSCRLEMTGEESSADAGL